MNIRFRTFPRHHTDLQQWDHKSTRFCAGYFVGSEGENGEHLRHEMGWPYSVYRRSNETGQGDYVLCHGIQNKGDAFELAMMLNARLGIDRYR